MEDIIHHVRSANSDKVTSEVHVVVMSRMRFSLGTIVWTRGVNDLVTVDTLFAKFVMDSLKRHANCDWGDLSAEDKRENDLSLDNGLRLLSSYQRGDWKIWIITESDRSATTILFPEEY